jgi:hypothetical protein
MRCPLCRKIDYEESDIDIIEYNHGIVIRQLLFTHPEKNARGIHTGGISVFKIYK